MLARTLFRQLTRSGKRLEASCLSKSLNINNEISRFDTLEYTSPKKSNESTSSYLKREFLSFSQWQNPEDIQECHDMAFKALRQSETRILQLEDPNWKPRPNFVKFHVGQIIRHKKYGYRGVITGWHETCQQSTTWQRRMRISTLKYQDKQPFYNLLVDSRDDANRQQTYGAQENIQDEIEFWNNNANANGTETEMETETGTATGTEVKSGGKECLENREIENFFESFSFRSGRYRLSEELRKRFPED